MMGGYWNSLRLIKTDPKKGIAYQRPTFFGSTGVMAGVQYPLNENQGTANLIIFRLKPLTNMWSTYGSFHFLYKNKQDYNYPLFNSDNVQLQFQDVTHGWLVSNHTAYKTTDGGKTWEKIESKGFPTHFQFVSNDVGYGFSSTGLFKSNDGGVRWTPIKKNS